jgi:hypothetical protein
MASDPNPVVALPANRDTARRLVPVIASAGPDKVFGLDQPLHPRLVPQMPPPSTMYQTTADQANDNIYSYRLRQTGTRGD